MTVGNTSSIMNSQVFNGCCGFSYIRLILLLKSEGCAKSQPEATELGLPHARCYTQYATSSPFLLLRRQILMSKWHSHREQEIRTVSPSSNQKLNTFNISQVQKTLIIFSLKHYQVFRLLMQNYSNDRRLPINH